MPTYFLSAIIFVSFFLFMNPVSNQVARPQTENETDSRELQRLEFTSPHMGTLFRVILYAADESLASTAADSAFRRVDEINRIMSDYLERSELNLLSASAGTGEAVRVSKPLFEVLSAAQFVSGQTHGAFDITAGPIVRLWRRIRNDTDPALPNGRVMREALEAVGYQYVQLDKENREVTLEKDAMQLDLGGIAKGYAAQEIRKVFAYFGIQAVLIDAGGDMAAGAAPPDQEGWIIAVTAHDARGNPEPFLLTLTQTALSTSGDLFQYMEIDGVRYSHIVDPGTGYGMTDRRMVTVVGKNATLVDAYSTAFSVMPVKEVLALIDRLDGYDVFIEVDENGQIRHYESSGFSKLRRR